MRLAILDDYQGAALTLADWASLKPKVEIEVFGDTLAAEDAVAKRLEPFAIVVAMRERTPFAASLIAKLPNLKLLITTGMRNASIDVKAAQEKGVVVSGTEMLPYPTAELTWGLILALARQIPAEERRMRAGGWQASLGVGLKGKTLGLVGLG